ncbi:hypothetical protein [Kitasatospora sp. NPDC093558]|uniref:hypothetical protein n=1 Tax=Kitasatospora sp. NPDC093558 TaxID=3155201 RepID=UPI00341B5FB0
MDRLFTLAWRYAAGLVRAEQLPMEAAHLLAADVDSPALRDLAGCSGRESRYELVGLLKQALAESGTTLPHWETAERCHLHHLAGLLAAGHATSAEVAAPLWERPDIAHTGAEHEFLVAVGPKHHVAHIAAHDPAAHQAWESAMVAAAARLALTTPAEMDAIRARLRFSGDK